MDVWTCAVLISLAVKLRVGLVFLFKGRCIVLLLVAAMLRLLQAGGWLELFVIPWTSSVHRMTGCPQRVENKDSTVVFVIWKSNCPGIKNDTCSQTVSCITFSVFPLVFGFYKVVTVAFFYRWKVAVAGCFLTTAILLRIKYNSPVLTNVICTSNMLQDTCPKKMFIILRLLPRVGGATVEGF